MELATPPPAARAPATRHLWWLMPLGLGGGTAAATFISSDRIPAAVLGLAATVGSTVCVLLLLRTRTRLRLAEEAHRTTRTEHARQSATERAAQKTQLAEQARAHEELLAESSRVYEERLSRQTAAYESRSSERAGVWQERLDHQLAAIALLGDQQLPAAVAQLKAGDAIDDIVPTAEQRMKAGNELQAGLGKVLRTALRGIEAELDRSTSAEQAVIGVGNRIHVLTSKLRGRLHEMQGEHGRQPAVAQCLMELDQAIGPADCLAASIVVLGGSDRPGRQWQEPQRLLSVVRGGIGRIKDFHRVQLRHLPELGVDGGLVDHLTLIFAHLLDNAARYSPPTEPVIVSGKEVPNGVGIEIQDSGKGLSEEKKREAEHALAGTSPGAGLGGISEDANIGLRVVGLLARRYDIRVTFADSPWLGTSVVVVVPHKYFRPLPALAPATAPPISTEPAAPHGTAPAAPQPEPAPVTVFENEDMVETTPGGLPRRRSRRGETAVETPQGGPSTVPAFPAVPPEASFAGLAAFADAGRDTGTATDGSPTAAADDHGTAAGGAPTEHRTEESD
ncbi:MULTISPECIES: ATP-binding protein [unclassified Streptomyces]|uniref:sensor histidine kinase n=1 Tax=unclassified Streptomyces TaxID=2593676 RepID=UPI000804E42B|nr:MULTISPECIES: ATP-binding protein [unclassified Streptomyces]MYR73881.1 ATP-binding protein [Streptomyces sp. SID4925]SBV03200.1 Histidine kinase-, DNA gyrase B-, and HSP90-like ATPase [Streptomyces sp. OspMP-M45]